MRMMLVLVLAAFICLPCPRAYAVAECGGIEDTCHCGAWNPYPCCENGGNCTWYSWHRACCEWDLGLDPWGNANTWAQYAAADPDFEVLDHPVVPSIGCRVSGTYGHVAWVVAVDGDEVEVMEERCCSGCEGGVRTWTYPASYFDGGYIVRSGIEPNCCARQITGDSEVVIDDDYDGGLCFEKAGNPDWWWSVASGWQEHHWTTFATAEDAPDNSGIWHFNIEAPGYYEVQVYLPEGENMSQQCDYRILTMDGESAVTVNQDQFQGAWISLGIFLLDQGCDQWIRLDDNTGEPYDILGRSIGFDAVKLVPRDCDCIPAEKESRTCGDCGESQRICGESCRWLDWGSCVGQVDAGCDDRDCCTVGDSCDAQGLCAGKAMECGEYQCDPETCACPGCSGDGSYCDGQVIVQCVQGVIKTQDCGLEQGVCMETGAEAHCCAPACTDRECGEDGCGGSCGLCGDGATCTPEGSCLPDEEEDLVSQADLSTDTQVENVCGECGEGEFGCRDDQAWTCIETSEGCFERSWIPCGDGKSCVGEICRVPEQVKGKTAGGCSLSDRGSRESIWLMLALLALLALPAYRGRPRVR